MRNRHLIRCAVVVLALAACICGCDIGDASYHALTQSQWDSVQKLGTGQYTLISNQELATLKQEADLGKSIGRYRTEREGFRVWRLDTATGNMCLLLAPDSDWKTPATSAQACGDQ